MLMVIAKQSDKMPLPPKQLQVGSPNTQYTFPTPHYPVVARCTASTKSLDYLIYPSLLLGGCNTAGAL